MGVADLSQDQANLDAQGFYSANASVSILADGPVTVANSGADLVTASSQATNLTQSIVYPGSFQAVSLTSSLDIVTAGGSNIANIATSVLHLVYPVRPGPCASSPMATSAPLTIAMEDASPSVLPGAFSTFATNGGVAECGQRRAQPVRFPVHPAQYVGRGARRFAQSRSDPRKVTPTPTRSSPGGDITDLILHHSPKMADVSAGLDPDKHRLHRSEPLRHRM